METYETMPRGIPPSADGGLLCPRRLVVAKSACLRFRLTAKTAPASLLLLSNANPLRWALRWGPPSAAYMIRLRGLGTHLFESAFVAVGLKYGSGKRRTRATLRFSRRARCPHRPFSGGPVCRPYEGNRNLILHPARATARAAPTASRKHIRNPGGRVRTPAPTANKEAGAFFT